MCIFVRLLFSFWQQGKIIYTATDISLYSFDYKPWTSIVVLLKNRTINISALCSVVFVAKKML